MTTLEIRIDGCTKRIEKIEKKITRLENLIYKKQQRIKDGKEENNKYPNGKYFVESECELHQEDIERAKRDLKSEQAKLKEYKEKRNKEIERDSKIPNVPAVEQFLQHWKEEANKYYINELQELKIFKSNVKDLKYKERIKKINNRFSREILYLSEFKGLELNNKIEKMLNNEVNRKRIDLYTRCSEKVGIITDASNLHIGDNLSLNGFVIGENGKAEVETIYAGGYNIQVLHYRVLIK